MYNMETLRPFRRRGIEALTRQFVYKTLQRKYGVTHVVVYIRADNYPGRNAARRYLTPIRRVWYLHYRGEVKFFMRAHERIPELRPAPEPPPDPAVVLARTSTFY
jgi:hypothetical protein